MPPKNSKSAKKKAEQQRNDWRNHDLYKPGVSYNRIVTRSQTAFNRIKNSDSDLDLFSDPSRYQPPAQPHLMEVMKGKYGAIQRTIITRSTGKYLSESEDLRKKLDIYKKYKPPAPDSSEISSDGKDTLKNTEDEALTDEYLSPTTDDDELSDGNSSTNTKDDESSDKNSSQATENDELSEEDTLKTDKDDPQSGEDSHQTRADDSLASSDDDLLTDSEILLTTSDEESDKKTD